MNREETFIDQRAKELRRAFDHGFAMAPPAANAPAEAFLAITVGDDAYALRLTDVAGLYADKKITSLPGDASELLGLANFRGALVPIYDLRALLGYPIGSAPRWLVLVAPSTPIALAFDRFDGHLLLPRSAIAQDGIGAQGRPHIAESLRSDGRVRPVVDVASIIELIKKRT